MKDLEIYLTPVTRGIWEVDDKELWGANVKVNCGEIPAARDVKIAIVGVKEIRGAEFGLVAEPEIDDIRKYLSRLQWFGHFPGIADLGDILPGKELKDTYFALENVVKELVKQDVVPLIIGGEQDLTFAQYKGYETLEQLVNMVSIDYKIDIEEMEGGLPDAGSYLSAVIAYQPNFLFNFSNIGHQIYFNSEKKLKMMGKMFFETLRLGELNSRIDYAEPLIRNADIISFDLRTLKTCSMPGNILPMPNGIDSEKACQLMWYAGISDKLSSVGLYGFDNDKKSAGAQLAAQMIWYFTEGFARRKGDFPRSTLKKYLKYTIQLNDNELELVFYKSPKSDRWWVEVPYPDGKEARYYRHLIVPCSYDDYKLATAGEMPDIWWQTYQKLV